MKGEKKMPKRPTQPTKRPGDGLSRLSILLTCPKRSMLFSSPVSVVYLSFMPLCHCAIVCGKCQIPCLYILEYIQTEAVEEKVGGDRGSC